MRRAIRGLGFVVAVVVVVGVLLSWNGPDPSSVPPRVLGASIERAATASKPSTTTTTSAPSPPSPSSPDPSPPSTVPLGSPTPPAEISSPPPGTAATTTPAVAPTTTTPPVASTDLLANVDALVRFDWRDALPGWSIQFVGPRPGLRGATFPPQHVIQVYVSRGEALDLIAHAFAHELGHAMDVTYLDDADRAAFNQARGRAPNFGWWVAAAADDFASGAGDWAECFAWMTTGGVGGFYSKLGPPPSAAVMALMTQLYQG